jgi:23S rRNA U2552 (ribose-2'-O)-methylase RlmE/FtsJ
VLAAGLIIFTGVEYDYTQHYLQLQIDDVLLEKALDILRPHGSFVSRSIKSIFKVISLTEVLKGILARIRGPRDV